MYHDHQRQDFVFQISSNDPQIPHQEDIVEEQDLVRGHEVFPEGSIPSHNNKIMGKGKQSQQQHMILFANSANNEANPSDHINCERKIMRRDNERQRRQHMAVLNSSLRSSLPLELIKGKRSISDHMNEAVNYINHMKMKIQELNAKREKIKRFYDYDSSTQDFGLENKILGHDLLNSVTKIMVSSTCLGEVEIVISSSGDEEEGLPLSGVLKVLLAEGLTVVGCASTRVNERFFHAIQREVDDLASLDLSELQPKLNYYFNSHE